MKFWYSCEIYQKPINLVSLGGGMYFFLHSHTHTHTDTSAYEYIVCIRMHMYTNYSMNCIFVTTKRDQSLISLVFDTQIDFIKLCIAYYGCILLNKLEYCPQHSPNYTKNLL